jgi:sulfite exporter TauE/SafE
MNLFDGTLVASAFVMGLLGSTHCVAMCGGIASVLSGGGKLVTLETKKPKTVRGAALAYNAGRGASYATAGALAGAFGMLASKIEIVSGVQIGLRLFAGVFMVVMGLAVAGVGTKLAMMERIGAPIWKRVAPLAQKLLPARSLKASLALGALWGFMPCGLVYAALGVALGTGSAASGAIAMAAFFFGTLPSMLAIGLVAQRVSDLARSACVRRAAGVAIIVFGLVNVRTAAAFASAHANANGASADSSAAHACCPHHHPSR